MLRFFGIEIIEQIIVFEQINGETQVREIKGVSVDVKFTYYKKKQELFPLGKIKIVSVVPSDNFQEIWKDFI